MNTSILTFLLAFFQEPSASDIGSRRQCWFNEFNTKQQDST